MEHFNIRCSAIADIMGPMGITEKQQLRIAELEGRTKPMTDNMKSEYEELLKKRNNPELPEGAKTYVKSWVKEKLFGRRQQVSSKYMVKGIETEEEGFTLMALQLNLGMVYKNTERRNKSNVSGECDLALPKDIFDNKSCWSLDTFPMFETEVPDKKYWLQLQGYSVLWPKAENLHLVYTLNDAPEVLINQETRWAKNDDEKFSIIRNMVFTEEGWDKYGNKNYDFTPIPDHLRVKQFTFSPDEKIKSEIITRTEYCEKFKNQILKTINHG